MAVASARIPLRDRRFRSRGLTGVVVILAVLALVAHPGPAAGGDAGEIDAYVRQAMEASGIPGVSYALVRNGEVEHLAAFGVADGTGRPMTVQTPVVIGSTGKTITALAIRQLVESGAIDPESPIRRYLPWFTLGTADAADAVTVRQLLEHRSGLSTADGQNPSYYEPGLTPEALLRSLSSVRLDRAPGTYEYSNLNYVILGAIVEAVSGQSYDAYLLAHVFGPLGMTHSYAALGPAHDAGLAEGHRYLFGVPVPYEEPYPAAMVAAGYQVSTAEDMAHLVAAFSNQGRYGGVDIAGGDGQRDYGVDWQPLAVSAPGSTPGHSGSTLASNTALMYTPSSGVGVVVLANANPTQFMNLPQGASDIALGILRLDAGGAQPSGSPTVRSVYLVVDALLLLLVSFTVVEALRLRGWTRRMIRSRRPRLHLVGSALANGVIPLLILVGLPLWIGSTGSTRAGDPIAAWRFLAWTLPDVAYALLPVAIGLAAIGFAKVYALARSARTTTGPGLERTPAAA